MGSMICLALHGFTDFNMHIPANALLLSVVMGITYKSLKINRHESERGYRYSEKKALNMTAVHYPHWIRWAMTLIVMAGSYYLVGLVVKPLRAERIVPTLPNSAIKKDEPTLEKVCKAMGYERSNAQYYFMPASLILTFP